MDTVDAQAYRAWFAALLHELADVPDDGRFYGTHARRQKRHPFAIHDWGGAGWFAEIARVGDRGSLQVWYDRYLDRNGDLHLGVWLSTGARVAKRVAEAVGSRRTWTWDDRDAEGFLKSASAREERRHIGRYMVDDWRPTGGIFVGSYVRASPHTRDAAEAVGVVVSGMRRLADAARPLDLSPESPPTTERYWELVRRLARPNQARFRADLIARHGAVCAISGCDCEIVIDAAHIEPAHAGGHEHADNGLLLRADLHRLFDAGLLTVSADQPAPRVLVAVQLADEYQRLGGRRVVGLSPAQIRRLRVRNRAWTPTGLRFKGSEPHGLE